MFDSFLSHTWPRRRLAWLVIYMLPSLHPHSAGCARKSNILSYGVLFSIPQPQRPVRGFIPSRTQKMKSIDVNVTKPSSSRGQPTLTPRNIIARRTPRETIAASQMMSTKHRSNWCSKKFADKSPNNNNPLCGPRKCRAGIIANLAIIIRSPRLAIYAATRGDKPMIRFYDPRENCAPQCELTALALLPRIEFTRVCGLISTESSFTYRAACDVFRARRFFCLVEGFHGCKRFLGGWCSFVIIFLLYTYIGMLWIRRSFEFAMSSKPVLCRFVSNCENLRFLNHYFFINHWEMIHIMILSFRQTRYNRWRKLM